MFFVCFSSFNRKGMAVSWYNSKQPSLTPNVTFGVSESNLTNFTQGYFTTYGTGKTSHITSNVNVIN